MDLLESCTAAGLLGQLASWTYLQDAIEQAPPILPVEASLEKSRHMAARLQPFFQSPWFLSSWFWREHARLTGMEGRDPLPDLERSLRLAADYRQLAEIEKCWVFLVRGGPEDPGHTPWPTMSAPAGYTRPTHPLSPTTGATQPRASLSPAPGDNVRPHRRHA